MSNDTRSRPMTAETIHTCSYYCERPECVRRQRDELRYRLEAELASAPQAEAQAQGGGDVVAWFPTNAQGEIIRNYGDGSPVYASKTKDEAEQAKRYHLGATGPVIPLYASPPPSAPAGVEDGPIDASENAEYIEHCADRLERCGLRITAGALRVIAHEHRALAQQPACRDEMSPEFTDSARAAIAWVLYHHQGGSSPVGQALRFALGMGAHEPLPDWRIAEAKRWAERVGAATADFHRHHQQPAAPSDENGGHLLVEPDQETALALADAPRSLRNYVAALRSALARVQGGRADGFAANRQEGE